MEKNLDLHKYHFDNLFFSNPRPYGKILLYQVGELYCGRSTEIIDHKQFCFEFTYVLDGKGTIYTNGKPFSLQKNHCYWSIEGDIHRIVTDKKEPLRFCYIGYAVNNDAKLNAIHDMLTTTFASEESRRFFAPFLLDDFLSLLTEISATDDIVPDMIESLIKIVILKSIRAITKTHNKPYSVNRSEKSYLVYQIANYIDNNIYSIKSLLELENVFNYNYQYLSRSFVKIMNKTLSDYYIAKKMQTAANLLITTDLSISKIAEKLNYSYSQVFSQAFLKYFKKTPDAYRKQPTF